MKNALEKFKWIAAAFIEVCRSECTTAEKNVKAW